MSYDLAKPLAPQVDREMARLLWEKMGQAYDADRVERIAVDARNVMDEGFPADFAFSEAYFLELTMYGDPQVKQSVGLMGLVA